MTLAGRRVTSNYYITPATGSSNQLKIRCGREYQHPGEGALRPPIEQLQLERRCWNEDHVPERLSPQAPVEHPRRTGKKRCYGHKSGGSIFCSSVQSQTHLSHSRTFCNPFKPFQIKWEVYFSKELCRSSLLCHRYDSTYICICIMWLYNNTNNLRTVVWLQITNNDNHHHHHHIALVARISLTLSRHSSLSFIALGRSSGQHPVSSHSCWMYVRAGRPAFARPCVGVHKSTSLMSSSLLLQQCP